MPEALFPHHCEIGSFTKFILFEKKDSSAKNNYIYVKSFVSPDDGETWKEAYVELKSGMKLVPCENQDLSEQWEKDCKANMKSYREFKREAPQEFPTAYQTTPGRAPDSIK